MRYHAFLTISAIFLTTSSYAFVAVADIENHWYDTTGKEKSHSAARCRVSLNTNVCFIRAEPLPSTWNPFSVMIGSIPKGLLFPTWARSPYCPTNFISAFSRMSPGQNYSPAKKYDQILISNHPSMIFGDVFSQLPRMAYVDRQCCCPSFSVNDFYYLHMETGPYEPNEINFTIKFNEKFSLLLPEIVRAQSPEYIPTRREKVYFKGEPNTRIIWEYRVNSWKKVQGTYYPAIFQYIRYTDVQARLEKEELIPIIKCYGKLQSVQNGGEENVTNRFGSILEVIDTRPIEIHGVKPHYFLTNSIWPTEGTQEYQERIENEKKLRADQTR